MMTRKKCTVGFNGIWTPKERRILERLDTPRKIQDYLDSVEYDPVVGFKSPRYVMSGGRAQCYSGAAFAAAAMTGIGYPPVIVEMRAKRGRDEDHFIAVYRKRGRLGAVSKSNFTTLRFRDPVYRTLRELVMSYFDFFFNINGEKTLVGYSQPLDLSKLDDNWMIDDCDEIVEMLDEAILRLRYYPILPCRTTLERVDNSLLAASLLVSNPIGLFKPKS